MPEANAVKVGIVGGTGQMGRWFETFFRDAGCRVIVSSRRTEISPEEMAKECDVVMISVPINETCKVIERVGPYVREGGVITDVTSIKEVPMKAMLEHSGAEVVGSHPVFGPSVKSMKGQTVVLCPARGDRWFRWLKDIYESHGAKVKISTPEEHDRMMGIIQCLRHFSTIVLGHAMMKLGADVKECLEFTSPIYRIRMDMVGRLFAQDPDLYADIEMLNPRIGEVLRFFRDSVAVWSDIILRQDRELFVSEFRKISRFFNDYTREAMEESDYLIRALVKRMENKEEEGRVSC